MNENVENVISDHDRSNRLFFSYFTYIRAKLSPAVFSYENIN